MERKGGFLFNESGVSLLEVMVAMGIILVVFLAMVALSADLFKSNSQATNLNVATEIAGMQVAQFNCLIDVKTVTPGSIGSYFSTHNSSSYTINPSSSPDNRSAVTACINPVLTQGGTTPSSLPENGGLGITIPYKVSMSFVTDPNNSNEEDATVTVSWDNGFHTVSFYDILGYL